MKVMTKKAPRCCRCGKYIDLEHDLDCVEAKMFQTRNISDLVKDKDTKFTPVDKGRLYYCGNCQDLLKTNYVRAYKDNGGQINGIAEQIIRCRECNKWLTQSCPLPKVNRADFFCGYAERKEK